MGVDADLLLVRYHSGDRSAGDALVREFENVTRYYARRWRRTWLDDEDLRQVARMAIWRAIDPAAPTPFDPSRGLLSVWISYAVNAALFRHVRDMRSRTQGLVYLDEPLHGDGSMVLGDLVHARDEPSDVALAREEQCAIVRRYLDALPEHQGDILRRRVDGETLRAIGASLGVTHETVRNRELKAWRAIRKALFTDASRARSGVQQA